MNLSLVGYAPSNNPEIAMAVLVPWAYQGSVDNRANLLIGSKTMDAYFNLKQAREAQANTQQGATQTAGQPTDQTSSQITGQ